MNTNCLEDKKCPKCGSEGPFQVSALVWILLYDNGADDVEDPAIEYDGASRAICDACGYRGQFGDFNVIPGVER